MDLKPDLSKTSSSAEDKGEVLHSEVVVVPDIDDSIESTDPGKTVWLIACTVSMGGFLFGINLTYSGVQYICVLYSTDSTDEMTRLQATIQASSQPSLSISALISARPSRPATRN